MFSNNNMAIANSDMAIVRQTIINRYFENRSLYNFNRYYEHDYETASMYMHHCQELEMLFSDLFKESLYGIYLDSDDFTMFCKRGW